MSRHPLVPEPFALGLFALGILLMFFPSLRVAGLIALLLGAIYSLLITLLKVLRR
jgi:hypothetical protein